MNEEVNDSVKWIELTWKNYYKNLIIIIKVSVQKLKIILNKILLQKQKPKLE